MWQKIVDWLSSIFDWIVDVLLWIPRWLWNHLLNSIEWLYAQIPVPDFLGDLPSYLAAIPADVMFFLSVFRVDDGLSIILSALVARFILRRIPLIGG